MQLKQSEIPFKVRTIGFKHLGIKTTGAISAHRQLKIDIINKKKKVKLFLFVFSVSIVFKKTFSVLSTTKTFDFYFVSEQLKCGCSGFTSKMQMCERPSGTTSSQQALLNCLVPTSLLIQPEPEVHPTLGICCQFSSAHSRFTSLSILCLFKPLLLDSLCSILHSRGKKLSKIFIIFLLYFTFHPPMFSSVFHLKH